MELKAVTTNINGTTGGYYVALPSIHNQSRNNFPLLMYLAGAGQLGNGSTDLKNLFKDGPMRLVSENRFPAIVKSGGKRYSFIVFTPQFKKAPTLSEVNDCIEYAKKNFKVDPRRIYLGGLSIGGRLTCDFAVQNASRLAAILSMSGAPVPDNTVKDKCSRIAAADLPVWSFHNYYDKIFNYNDSKNFVADINEFNPEVPAKFTLFYNSGGNTHDAWSKPLDPNYRENGLNIYEWLLQYHR
jgi:predicted peptidase